MSFLKALPEGDGLASWEDTASSCSGLVDEAPASQGEPCGEVWSRGLPLVPGSPGVCGEASAATTTLRQKLNERGVSSCLPSANSYRPTFIYFMDKTE